MSSEQTVKTVEWFEASNGVILYRIPVEVFPGLMAYVHLAAHDGRLTLFDVGSGFDRSHRDIVDGFAALKDRFGFDARLEDVDQVIISHGHIDHVGGLNRVLDVAKKARVGAHVLATPVLLNYDERVLLTAKAMKDFLVTAGVPDDHLERLLQMYMLTKQSFRSVSVDVVLHDGDVVDGVFEIVHVPGHTPGQVMIRIGDILLTADHVLPGTSVSLAPESIMPYTGVGHYIESLEKAALLDGVRVALGGHESPMYDYADVTQHTLESARQKIDIVLQACDQPRTIFEIAKQIYNGLAGYIELLKLWQTGARIEYLYQRGLVRIDNLDALETNTPQPFRYVSTG